MQVQEVVWGIRDGMGCLSRKFRRGQPQQAIGRREGR